VKLLRVLEDGVFYPVGGDKPIHSDVRVLAATNRDLGEAIGEGVFREDLYFRLGVVKINMPPLHDRREDIIPLLYHFGRRNGLKGYSERAIDLLTRYDWPGNVRQLRNFAARMAALHPEEEVSLADVERFISEQALGRKNLPVATGHTREEAGQELIYHALIQLGQEVKMLRDLITANLPVHNDYEIHSGENARNQYKEKENGLSLQNMEKDIIEKALHETGGNRKDAARILGIGERTLYRKLKKYNLN
jgi:DNA-binding NtrC family response regulator